MKVLTWIAWVALFSVGCSSSNAKRVSKSKRSADRSFYAAQVASRGSHQYLYVHGESTLLTRRGKAVAPRHAPRQVHLAIQAGNRLQGKPYRWGGGHAKVEDRGYDCSGTVSYALIHAGLLGSPMPSSGFRRYGKRGPGKWITIYVKPGHTFMTIGGLRLDTGWGKARSGPKWRPGARPTDGYIMRHPPGL